MWVSFLLNWKRSHTCGLLPCWIIREEFNDFFFSNYTREEDFVDFFFSNLTGNLLFYDLKLSCITGNLLFYDLILSCIIGNLLFYDFELSCIIGNISFYDLILSCIIWNLLFNDLRLSSTTRSGHFYDLWFSNRKRNDKREEFHLTRWKTSRCFMEFKPSGRISCALRESLEATDGYRRGKCHQYSLSGKYLHLKFYPGRWQTLLL